MSGVSLSVCLTVWTQQGSLGPDTMILVTLSLCSLWALAASQSLTSLGWSQSPVTDEDRRRLVGSFVSSESDSSEVSVVRPQSASVIDTDPVLGEVIRHNQDGEPRPVRQQQAEAGQGVTRKNSSDRCGQQRKLEYVPPISRRKCLT